MPNSTFLWGAATSAHQVEGENRNNDWWEWEQADPERTSSSKAADHYHRFKDDFALAKQLGHTAHRLSVEWSRLQPKMDEWNNEAVAHYREVLIELKRLDMKIFVTLHHFTNPLWLAQRGGWTWKGAAHAFELYSRHAAQSFGDLVDFWITINEPNVLASHGYWHGYWPPGKKRDAFLWLCATKTLIEAHHRGYKAIHQVLPDARVGIGPSIIGYFPARPQHMGDLLIARFGDWIWNHTIANRVVSSCDFWGLQYYYSVHKRSSPVPLSFKTEPWNGPTTDMGWPIDPRGLATELRHFSSYGLPIYITENGIADASDGNRAQFIHDHIAVIEQAVEEGIDIRGYLYWSLLDNFEWAEGFGPRFGLIEVDYNTQKRRIRPSAYAFQRLMQASVGRLSRNSSP